jgi:hypothetical protein
MQDFQKSTNIEKMEYAICTVAAAPVRKEPSHKTEMVSQLLFGETVEVLEKKAEWFFIRTIYDQYEGWITYHLVEEIEKEFAFDIDRYICSGLNNLIGEPYDFFCIPMGSSLTGFQKSTKKLWKNKLVYRGAYNDTKKGFDLSKVSETAKLWINVPYLWGGKTIMGVDCSGFVQTIFKLNGIRLLRDAYQQATQGKEITNLSEIKGGEVAFFKNEQERITHVGILLSNNQIIHASGKVRIDKIDEEGIINVHTGKRTHQLHSMKRFF